MNHFQQYLAEEFVEDYEDGRLSRRDALKMIAAITGSMVTASTILAGCTPLAESTTTSVATIPATGAASGTVAPNDPAVSASDIEFPAGSTNLMAYLARPPQGDSFPVILVCHENRGLTAHIKDVARRFAQAGYAAIAVDLLSRHGGTDSLDQTDVPGILSGISPDQFVQDFRDAWGYMGQQPYALAEKVGMTGFCFGGGVTWLMATRMPELLAAVPFYGPNPPLADVPNIHAAVLAIYGELDQRIDAGIPAIEQAMQENGKTFEKVIYPNANHAFFNDTGTRYVPEAAQDAWQRTLKWFAEYVKG